MTSINCTSPTKYRKDLDKDEWTSYIKHNSNVSKIAFWLDYVYDVYVSNLERNICPPYGLEFIRAYEEEFDVKERYRYGTMH